MEPPGHAATGLEVLSMKDGKASIEHQISIHINDLVDVDQVEEITLTDVLSGLAYVMEYRIEGGRYPHLDLAIMRRLAKALLNNMGKQDKKLVNRKFTPESTMAFRLFAEFLAEVEEFRVAVTEYPESDLRQFLSIHLRCKASSPLEDKLAAAKILTILQRMPEFKDWMELVDEKYQGQVESVLKEIAPDMKEIQIPEPEAELRPPPSLYFDRKIPILADMFKTDVDKGLNSSDVPALRAYYGTNELPKPPRPSVIILLIVAIVEAALQEWREAVILFAVVIMNVAIGFSQEWKAKQALEALMSLSVPQAVVIRDGVTSTIDSADIVPGDIVPPAGDAVPADLRIAEASQLEIVEALLTGESVPVAKSPKHIRSTTRKLPLGDCKGNAFMSTVVAKGRGKGIAVRTGRNSEIGKISAAITSQPTVKTPIQQRLNRLGLYLVLVSVVACVLMVVIGVAWGRPAGEMVKIGISLAVSVIPEGLVAVVTVTMAIGVSRMAAENAIVRKLPSVETLGSVTVICSDKTGTLTEGKMGTAQLRTVDGNRFVFTQSTDLDPTVALVVAAEKSGFGKEFWTNTIGLTKSGEFAFDSDRKLMSSIYASGRSGTLPLQGFASSIVLVKGAPEGVLSRCVAYLPGGVPDLRDEAGLRNPVPIDDAAIQRVSDQSAEMAGNGLRVLGLAVRLVDSAEAAKILQSENPELSETDLCFVGLVGLIDPPKAGVAEAVATCKEAGIKVVMITGDHIATASAIARQLGILDPSVPSQNRAMKGTDLDLLSDEALGDLRPFPGVFARVSPDNKLKIVTALQMKKQFAAMTGDGVNDAPAIKKADVGIAMGKAGTEITKQAADIVLADDNFVTIVKAVEEGRRVYDNIIKFIVYLLSCNLAEIIVMSAAVNVDLPFTTMMILWANIWMDVPPSMALSVEKAEPDVMRRPPRPPEQGVLTRVNSTVILIQGFTMGLISLAVYLLSTYNVLRGFDTLPVRQSLAYAALCCMQLQQSFLSRSVSESVFKLGVFANRWLIAGVAIALLFLLMGLYVPGLNDFLTMVPLPGIAWAVVVVCLVIHFTLIETFKVIARHLMQTGVLIPRRGTTFFEKV
ncbi:hypothetical protein DFJ74DRAFT_711164 [Hyaloraphidium curvatum]|nr:hypothetical protein DFJ74DRAFT_711164 [Hyaloraphidium curvatum]